MLQCFHPGLFNHISIPAGDVAQTATIGRNRSHTASERFNRRHRPAFKPGRMNEKFRSVVDPDQFLMPREVAVMLNHRLGNTMLRANVSERKILMVRTKE